MFSSRCSSLALKPDAKGPDFKLPQPQAPEAERRDFYRSHRIAGLQKGWSEVDGNLYDAEDTQAYYMQASATAEAALQEKARAYHRNSFSMPALIVLSGAVTGFAAGWIYDKSRGIPAVSEYGDATDSSYGLIFGAMAGVLPAVLDMLYYQHQANKLKHQAADSFNGRLMENLSLKIVPQPGGAKAGVDLKF